MFKYISASISTFKGLVFSKRIQIIINLICVVRQDGIFLHVKHLRYLWGKLTLLSKIKINSKENTNTKTK